MDSNNVFDLCRICLVKGANIPIFEAPSDEHNYIINKLNLCLGIKVEDIYGYPRNICEECNSTINVIMLFLNKYKESCKALQKMLNVSIKTENIKDDNHSFHDYDRLYEQEEMEIDINKIKNESKIVFNDAHQFEVLVKPLIKQEPETESKSKLDRKRKKSKTTKKVLKKNATDQKKKPIPFSTYSNAISSSILEGQFVFVEEQWRLNPAQKPDTIKKEDTNKSDKKISQKGKGTKTKEDSETQCQDDKTKAAGPVAPRLCEHCGKTFDSHEKLKIHIHRFHIGEARVKCPSCPKILANKDGLRKHVRLIHTGVKNLICPSCGKAFAYQAVLDNHFKRVHSTTYVKKKYECKICGKLYSTAQVLLMHERSVHTGERPEVCTICGTRFTHISYLREHMRLHTGETPFKCPVCGRGYAQRCNMKSHIKHTHKVSQLDEMQLKTVHPRYIRLMKP